MPSKYDTNPLDPEFPEKARAASAADAGGETRVLGRDRGPETNRLFEPAAQTAPADEQTTRRFADDDPRFAASYPPPPLNDPYNGQFVPADHRAAGAVDMSRSGSRKVEKIGLPENILTAVPYLPITLGMIAGLLILLFVPKTEPKVRFHAAQGLAAHLAILLITSILGIFSDWTGIAGAASTIFTIVTTVMLIVFAVKAWKGKPVHIESVDDLTNWLEDKIGPIKTDQ
ncbi:MAG: DUF4870 domain-containing protein [Pyrinomonadaceae bacterium]